MTSQSDIQHARFQVESPRRPDEPQPHSFPLVASIAPVLGAVLVWAITRSPFALVFAALGPLIAVASLADSRLHARRLARREAIRFAAELAECRRAIADCHDRERAGLALDVPLPAVILKSQVSDPERWRVPSGGPLPVCIGIGSVASSTRLGVDGASRARDDALAKLHERAATLVSAQLVVDSRLGIGIVGPPVLAGAMARGILLQLANLLSPAEWRRTQPALNDWLATLPHQVDHGSPTADGCVRWSNDAASIPATITGSITATITATITVAIAESLHDLPSDCRIVLNITGGVAEVVRTAGLDLSRQVQPVFLSEEDARSGAFVLDAAAAVRGLRAARQTQWRPASFADLLASDVATGALGAVLGWGESGPLAIDLVEHGPHAIVGGTTGSGKSELLVTWVLGMAAAHAPEQVTFLLVDFKGGSAFAPLSTLPHVVGVITDLDERSARRALLSLTAELKFRERCLAELGARSIDEAGSALARLVIVVDEFAAMVSGFPELHELFADLAARGRSLGIHLILCTQRPAGVVRDSTLANCGLRISLRVNNRPDSIAVIGTTAAAELPPSAKGAVLVSIAAEPPVRAEVALSDGENAAFVAARWGESREPIRRPWCDELPRSLSIADLPTWATGIGFGLLDQPEVQAQPTAVYDPPTDGNLLVIGGQASGKTCLLSTLAANGSATWVPGAPDRAWDLVSALVAELRSGAIEPGLLLVDDLDALIVRFGADHQPAFLDLLLELLRGGSALGLHVVVAVRRVVSALQSVVGLCESTVILRLPARQDHLIAGGVGALFRADAPAGSGEWKGSPLQVALPATQSTTMPATLSATPPLSIAGRRALIVVSTHARAFAAGLRPLWPAAEIVELDGAGAGGKGLDRQGLDILAGGSPLVVVGDPQGWQANWAALGALRSKAAMAFDGCAVADFRAISASRQLPPPLPGNAGALWLLEPDGTLGRATAPTGQ